MSTKNKQIITNILNIAGDQNIYESTKIHLIASILNTINSKYPNNHKLASEIVDRRFFATELSKVLELFLDTSDLALKPNQPESLIEYINNKINFVKNNNNDDLININNLYVVFIPLLNRTTIVYTEKSDSKAIFTINLRDYFTKELYSSKTFTTTESLEIWKNNPELNLYNDETIILPLKALLTSLKNDSISSAKILSIHKTINEFLKENPLFIEEALQKRRARKDDRRCHYNEK